MSQVVKIVLTGIIVLFCVQWGCKQRHSELASDETVQNGPADSRIHYLVGINFVHGSCGIDGEAPSKSRCLAMKALSEDYVAKNSAAGAAPTVRTECFPNPVNKGQRISPRWVLNWCRQIAGGRDFVLYDGTPSSAGVESVPSYLLVKMDFAISAEGGSDVNGNEYIGGVCGVDGASSSMEACQRQKNIAEQYIKATYTGSESYLATAFKYGCFESKTDWRTKLASREVFEFCKTLAPGKDFSTYAGISTADGTDVLYHKSPE